jgi:hypothetical protein
MHVCQPGNKPGSMTYPFQCLAIVVLLLFSVLFTTNLDARQSDGLSLVTYTESDADFPNPERGFYIWTEWVPGGETLNPDKLRAMRTQNRSMIIRLYYLAIFRDSDFTESFLNQVEADFEALREAGMKAVIRFRYSKSESEPDAPLDRVLAHLDQLKPVLERNYDVIAVANAGFIGAWGEWHSSHHNLTTVANMRSILYKFMEVLPERPIQIRYPQSKLRIFNDNQPITAEEAFDGSYKSRAGHHNDCFLASPTDVGTYRFNVDWEKNFLSQDTRYVPMGGETCYPRPDAGERYHCTTALEELDMMNWSILNSNYSRITLDHWVDEGCMPEVERRLGYRFVLDEGRFSAFASAGGGLTFQLDLANKGFAQPYNPRGVQVILRDVIDPDNIWEATLPADPRFWQSGNSVNLAYEIGVPQDMPESLYEVMFNLPDPMPQLRHRPEYSIRLGNEDVWDEATGFNSLNHIVEIGSDPAEAYGGDIWFEPFGTWTSIESGPSNLPAGFSLHQNYPNPFNPTTTISFDLNNAEHARLEVYSIIGHRVAVLADEFRQAGTHHLRFDAAGLSSGVYLYRLTSSAGIITRSMVLIK